MLTSDRYSWGLLRESIDFLAMDLVEVSRSGKTLRQALEDGEIPHPPLVSWNDWQKWRRDIGRRPTTAVDDVTCGKPL